MNDSEVGLKYDTGKPDYSLVPPVALEAIATVMTYGANKYAKDNWRLVKPVERYYSALMRHLEAVRKGEWLDKESGYPHMWHVLTNATFLTVLWGQKYAQPFEVVMEGKRTPVPEFDSKRDYQMVDEPVQTPDGNYKYTIVEVDDD